MVHIADKGHLPFTFFLQFLCGNMSKFSTPNCISPPGCLPFQAFPWTHICWMISCPLWRKLIFKAKPSLHYVVVRVSGVLIFRAAVSYCQVIIIIRQFSNDFYNEKWCIKICLDNVIWRNKSFTFLGMFHLNPNVQFTV